MPNTRKSTNVLKLSGAFKKNPARGRERIGEPEPTEDIGDPPEGLPVAVRACWVEIVKLAHAGTLCSGDRLLVEHGAQLLAHLRAEEWVVHPTILVRWEAFLGRMGMTPADRSKVKVHKPAAKSDPLDEFAAAG